MKFESILLIIILVVAGGIVSCHISNQQESVADKVILFRVKVSNVGLQSSSLVRGKQPTDFVEVKLPGQLYDPPKQFNPIRKQAANWNTPTDAAVADFSAFKADDSSWILEDFVPEEEKDVRSLLDDKDAHQQNRKMFEARTERDITGQVKYKEYVIVLTRDSGQAHPVPLTFKQTSSGWKRTNALSKDDTFDIVFSALYNGGEVMVVK